MIHVYNALQWSALVCKPSYARTLTLVANVSSGICTDLLVYSLIVPVLPFQLERLKYSGVSGLVGWILLSYVRMLLHH